MTQILMAPTVMAPTLMAETSTTPDVDRDPGTRETIEFDRAWSTVVWNDPVNLMTYVTHVFRHYFGYSKREAERLMLLVHHEGRATVATGPREEMERHTEAMHEFGLWATVEKL
jgi:ATP-dependent Clp protease adaptor protein ClpS